MFAVALQLELLGLSSWGIRGIYRNIEQIFVYFLKVPTPIFSYSIFQYVEKKLLAHSTFNIVDN